MKGYERAQAQWEAKEPPDPPCEGCEECQACRKAADEDEREALSDQRWEDERFERRFGA